MTPEEVVRALGAAVDVQDWEALSALLATGFTARYVHTGEVLDAEGYVRLNREYPGSWRFEVQDVVASGDRAAARARVHDDETFHVALFLTVREGLVAELVEVWTEAEAPPPPDRRPA